MPSLGEIMTLETSAVDQFNDVWSCKYTGKDHVTHMVRRHPVHNIIHKVLGCLRTIKLFIITVKLLFQIIISIIISKVQYAYISICWLNNLNSAQLCVVLLVRTVKYNILCNYRYGFSNYFTAKRHIGIFCSAMHIKRPTAQLIHTKTAIPQLAIDYIFSGSCQRANEDTES